MNRKLFSHDSGSGIPVLLVHGYPLNHSIWEQQFILSDSFRIIAPDLPGFGQSEPEEGLTMHDYADRLAALLDEKKIDNAAVVGHSMGGYIALAFAERHPSRMRGLGLVCSQAGADTEEGRAGRIKNAERVPAEGFDFIIDAMIGKLLSPATLQKNSGMSDQIRAIMKKSAPQGVTAALRAMAARKDQFETLKKLSVPVFIAAGKDDSLIPLEKSSQMADVCKSPVFVSLPDSGHMAMMENPSEFNTALRKYLDGLK